MSGTVIRIDRESVDHTIVAVVQGELDLVSNDMLRTELDHAVEAGLNVRLDLREVQFMDSAAVRVVEQAAAALREQGRTLYVVNPQPIVRRLLILLGADHLLEDSRQRRSS